MAHGPKSKKRKVTLARRLNSYFQSLGYDGLNDAVLVFERDVILADPQPTAEEKDRVAEMCIDAMGQRSAILFFDRGVQLASERIRAISRA